MNQNLIVRQVMEVPKIVIREEQELENKKIVRGYAIVFNKEAPADSWLGEGWVERIAKDAFNEVDMSKTRVLANHIKWLLVGRADVNARIEIDDTGVFVEVELLDTTAGNDLYENIKAGLIDGMSFNAHASAWEIDETNKVLTWSKFEDLIEVSFVTFPFYEQTTSIAKDMEFVTKEIHKDKEQFENTLSDLDKILNEMEEI